MYICMYLCIYNLTLITLVISHLQPCRPRCMAGRWSGLCRWVGGSPRRPRREVSEGLAVVNGVMVCFELIQIYSQTTVRLRRLKAVHVDMNIIQIIRLTGGTNMCLGTVRILASTAWSLIPLRRIWISTILSLTAWCSMPAG